MCNYPCVYQFVAVPSIENKFCAFVEATRVGALPFYGKWSCDELRIPTTPPCENEWPGIVCFKFKIIAISLPNLELQGTIPSELFALTAMTRLDLSRNNFTGSIPSQLADVSLLEYLDLSGNNYLRGPIPDGIGELTQLKHAFLARTQLSGELPSSISNLTKLESLSVWKTSISGNLPTALGSMTALRQLELSENKFNGEIPVEIALLTNLMMLDISGNYLSGEVPSSILSMGAVVFSKNAPTPTNISNGIMAPF